MLNSIGLKEILILDIKVNSSKYKFKNKSALKFPEFWIRKMLLDILIMALITDNTGRSVAHKCYFYTVTIFSLEY